jgi:hypothetical protein
MKKIPQAGPHGRHANILRKMCVIFKGLIELQHNLHQKI